MNGDLSTTLTQVQYERERWKKEAARGQRNIDYYRGLIQQIGAMLGEDAYLADDGTRSEDILCAKVPELVAQALAERRALEACAKRLRVMVHEWEEIIGTEEENKTPGDVLERAKAALAALGAARWPQTVTHGVDCPKEPHTSEGYLHDAEDDSPYRIDGLAYCGRCHRWLDAARREGGA